MVAAKRGRPFSDKPTKTTRLEIRVTPEEKQEVMEFAKASDLSLYDLLQIGMEAVQQRDTVTPDSDAALRQIAEIIKERGIL